MAQSTERVSELDCTFLTFPEGVSIEEFKADLNRANKIYEKNGFGADRYKVYQVKADDKNDTYRYMWISTWSNDTEYENSHSEEMATFWDEFFHQRRQLSQRKPINSIYRNGQQILIHEIPTAINLGSKV